MCSISFITVWLARNDHSLFFVVVVFVSLSRWNSRSGFDCWRWSIWWTCRHVFAQVSGELGSNKPQEVWMIVGTVMVCTSSKRRISFGGHWSCYCVFIFRPLIVHVSALRDQIRCSVCIGAWQSVCLGYCSLSITHSISVGKEKGCFGRESFFFECAGSLCWSEHWHWAHLLDFGGKRTCSWRGKRVRVRACVCVCVCVCVVCDRTCIYFFQLFGSPPPPPSPSIMLVKFYIPRLPPHTYTNQDPRIMSGFFCNRHFEIFFFYTNFSLPCTPTGGKEEGWTLRPTNPGDAGTCCVSTEKPLYGENTPGHQTLGCWNQGMEEDFLWKEMPLLLFLFSSG